MRWLSRVVALCGLPAILAGACRDPVFGNVDPLMAVDTFDVALPGAHPQLAPALDLTASAGFIGGPRFPERAQDSNRGWDVAARDRDGELVLISSGLPGYDTRAALLGPIQNETFEGLDAVPPGARFEADAVAAMQPGALYVVRSREFGTSFGGCLQYSKLETLAADPEAGVFRVRVATNERCYDTRLPGPGS